MDSAEREDKFLKSALSLALIDTLKGEEKPKSFRHNRLKNAEEVVLRVCDIYLPDGINQIAMNKVWEILDGPVMDVLRAKAPELRAAIATAREQAA